MIPDQPDLTPDPDAAADEIAAWADRQERVRGVRPTTVLIHQETHDRIMDVLWVRSGIPGPKPPDASLTELGGLAVEVWP